MSNTARVMSFRVSTNLSRSSPPERLKMIKCGVGKEGFCQSKDVEKRVNLVNSVEISTSDLKIRKQCLVSPAKAVLVSAFSTVEVAPDYYMETRAKHMLMLLVKLITLSLKKRAQFQMVLEKAIVDCRFFTFFAIAGSLLGSVLCFVEGCLIILKSYMQYLHMLSHKADQGHIMHLLIEAIDMYLVGTALLIFGVGFYTMFVGSKVKGSWFAGSNLFGLFHMKGVPSWVEMHSIGHAKSKLGHAVVMILQVGVLEKFQSVPLVTGLDLACFAGTLLISSASIFVLSKLSLSNVPHN